MSQSQHIWQTKLTSNSSTDIEGIGSIREQKGKKYLYIQYDNGAANIAALVGMCVLYKSGSLGAGTYIVTPDVSDGDGTAGAKAVGSGQLLAALTDQYYGWIQIGGPSDNVLSIDVTAGVVGDSLTAVGAGDGTLDVITGSGISRIVASLIVVTASAQKVEWHAPLS